MTTAIDICNRALSRLGIDAPIGDLEEDSKESRLCALWYEHSRDTLLELHSWPFAKRFIDLNLLASVEPTDWSYAYSLPASVLAVRGLWAGARQPSDETRLEYEVQNDAAGTGRILVTDDEAAVLMYTRRVENPNLFSPLFIDALVWGLASDLAMPMKVDAQMAQMARAAYELAQRKAQARALKDKWSTPLRSDFITIRG